MKKIVFPTDFSSAAENAFLYALSVTKLLQAELTLVHVYELPELGRSLKTTTKEIYEMMEMEALENFKKSVVRLRKIAEDNGFGDISFSQEMIEGETIYTITNYAKQQQADLIVLGTTGATGLKEVFLGSVASGVIDESPCCVLSIPAGATCESVKTIAYLSNYKPEEVPSYAAVVEFGNHFGAAVKCVHYEEEASSLTTQESDKWLSLLDQSKDSPCCEVITGPSFEEALLAFQKNSNIDMLAVQPRKKNFFTRLFGKSVSKTIAHHFCTPLLTLPKL